MFVLVRPENKTNNEDSGSFDHLDGAPVEKNQLPRFTKIMRPKCLDNHSARCFLEENNRVLFSSQEKSTDALFLKKHPCRSSINYKSLPNAKENR